MAAFAGTRIIKKETCLLPGGRENAVSEKQKSEAGARNDDDDDDVKIQCIKSTNEAQKALEKQSDEFQAPKLLSVTFHKQRNLYQWTVRHPSGKEREFVVRPTPDRTDLLIHIGDFERFAYDHSGKEGTISSRSALARWQQNLNLQPDQIDLPLKAFYRRFEWSGPKEKLLRPLILTILIFCEIAVCRRCYRLNEEKKDKTIVVLADVEEPPEGMENKNALGKTVQQEASEENVEVGPARNADFGFIDDDKGSEMPTHANENTIGRENEAQKGGKDVYKNKVHFGGFDTDDDLFVGGDDPVHGASTPSGTKRKAKDIIPANAATKTRKKQKKKKQKTSL